MADYGLTLVTAPAEEPVSLEEVKLHCKIEVADDNRLLDRLIRAARKYYEGYIGKTLITSTWRLTLEEFPCDSVIRLPKPPLQSVTSIAYVDTAGAAQTVLAADYQVVIDQGAGFVVPAYGDSWPTARGQHGAVTVTYVAGYGLAKDVDETHKQAIMLLIDHWYENRKASTDFIRGGSTHVLPLAFESLAGMNWSGEYR